jgi:hypothetical protein
MRTPSIKSALAVLAGTLTLGACSTFSPDGGMSVAANVAEAPSRQGTATPMRDEIEVTVVKPRMTGHSGQH